MANDDNGAPYTRRSFLTSAALAGAAASLPASSLATARVNPDAASAPRLPAFELDEITVAELQQRMHSGALTAEAITQRYRDRIAAVDKSGPSLNAIIELNPDAPSIARALDAERRQKGPRGPLHGIPVLIKDNIGTADRMSTTAGSLALKGFAPTRDSGVAQMLRAAGAVILGKTNLSEWANFRSGHATSGWSGRGGLTRNPYALDRNPCGSSSGSAAGVSANLAAVTVGTETNGSIVCPSSANGVVGIKPTVGLVSRSGIIPISASQDTAGPIARTVTDAAALLGALAATDVRDPATLVPQRRAYADYTRFLDPDGLRGKRIGIVRQMFFFDHLDPILDAALAAMQQAGAILVAVAIPSLAKFGDAEGTVLSYEFKAGLNAYLSQFPSAPVHSLADVIAFNRTHADQEMPFFGQGIFLESEKRGPLTDQAYLDARTRLLRLARSEGIDAVMDQHHLDALFAPTGGPAWTTDLINGDHELGGTAGLAAMAGYPNITVPAGFLFGLPVGVSFFGRPWSEPTLIAAAYGFEQATHIRRPPAFLATADLDAIGGRVR